MTRSTAKSVGDDDVYKLTRAGETELKGSRTSLPAFALEVLVRIDGKASVAELASGMPGTQLAQVRSTIDSLAAQGLIAVTAKTDDNLLEFGVGSGLAKPLAPSASALSSAEGAATVGLSSLEQQGFYVRIARRPADRPRLPTERRPVAVIVEDEEQLAKFLKHFMSFEGFDARVASNRQEIVETLRQPTAPDLILLDVMLPDVDGFNVLMKLREHPVLRKVPIIMLTAKATRESVIRGLAGGADGYITKPFQTEVLVKAIQTLFGMEHGAS